MSDDPRSTPAVTVELCVWCPIPTAPSPLLHPGGQPEHLLPERAALREWSDLAYELWALACNSTTDGNSSEADWNAARDRLRDRFHKALAELPTGRS